MQNGKTVTYESGAHNKEKAKKAAKTYFKNHEDYNFKEVEKMTRGPAQ